jgi:hypothetical protein
MDLFGVAVQGSEAQGRAADEVAVGYPVGCDAEGTFVIAYPIRGLLGRR